MAGSWDKELHHIQQTYDKAIRKAADLRALDSARVGVLGRKGRLTLLLRNLKDLPLETRRKLGPELHRLKERLKSLLGAREQELVRLELETEIRSSAVPDLTLPPRPLREGHLHPLTRTLDLMTETLARLGFSYADGPTIESDHYNFEALNIPESHPARDMQDTFYIAERRMSNPESRSNQQSEIGNRKLLLRTHTSPVQIRKMESSRPPLRIMAPGRVFRHEAVDASHSAVFHQIEGLYVDRQVSLADLKGTLRIFMQCLFGPQTQIRFRPSYFPFTEPSAELDIRCIFCQGNGCSVCKKAGWLEMLGAGLVHPLVLKGVGYDPDLWSGFAFGIGVERVAMLLYGIQDIRMFYENDARFLGQF